MEMWQLQWISALPAACSDACLGLQDAAHQTAERLWKVFGDGDLHKDPGPALSIFSLFAPLDPQMIP